MNSTESLRLLRDISNRLWRLEDTFALTFKKEIESAKREARAAAHAKKEERNRISAEYLRLGLDDRYARSLVRAGIPFIRLYSMSDEDLLMVRNLGKVSLRRIREWQVAYKEQVDTYISNNIKKLHEEAERNHNGH